MEGADSKTLLDADWKSKLKDPASEYAENFEELLKKIDEQKQKESSGWFHKSEKFTDCKNC